MFFTQPFIKAPTLYMSIYVHYRPKLAIKMITKTQIIHWKVTYNDSLKNGQAYEMGQPFKTF